MNREDEGETENEELDEEEKQELESTLNELKLSHASQYLDFPFEKWCEVFMKVKRPAEAGPTSKGDPCLSRGARPCLALAPPVSGVSGCTRSRRGC